MKTGIFQRPGDHTVQALPHHPHPHPQAHHPQHHHPQAPDDSTSRVCVKKEFKSESMAQIVYF